MKTSSIPELSDQTIEVLTKIPLFKGLALSELQGIFGICQFRKFKPSEPVYRMGEPGRDTFILLEGDLSVRTSAEVDIARIRPVGLVGEMGLFTGHPRSVSVVAAIGPWTWEEEQKSDLFPELTEGTGTASSIKLIWYTSVGVAGITWIYSMVDASASAKRINEQRRADSTLPRRWDLALVPTLQGFQAQLRLTL